MFLLLDKLRYINFSVNNLCKFSISLSLISQPSTFIFFICSKSNFDKILMDLFAFLSFLKSSTSEFLDFISELGFSFFIRLYK